ncbi:MAG: hypothetical protein J6S80_04625 [Alphaproteobacteria bacterium]|nr:hypothetical protein [Alphaproteobacteria bacterium]
MPEQAQSKYMNLNEFLETFFAAQDAKEEHIGYFPNMVKYNEDVRQLYLVLSGFAQELGPNTTKLFKQYWDARNDNSPAAQDFLNMVKTITLFYAENTYETSTGFRDACKTVIHLCQNGKIKNPEFALRLLKTIYGEFDRFGPLKLEVSRMIAMNPVAQPIDVYRYSDILVRTQSENRPYDKGAPEELMGILNDQMVKTDANIDKELSKDFPNTDAIEKMGGRNLAGIAENILHLVEYQVKHGERNSGDVDEIRKIVAFLRDKYNIDNILGLNKKPYGPQYEEQASLKLAKMEPQYEKMERDLGTAQKSQREMRSAYDEQINEIRALKDKIAKLESELKSEKSRNATLNATIQTFIMDAEKRANGTVVNIRKDMSEQIRRLKANIDKGSVSLK